MENRKKSLSSNDRNLSLQHFKRFPQLVWVLDNVYHNVKDLKYDFPIIICGDEGNGKSMLLLHIIELWYRVILGVDDWGEHYIRHVRNTRLDWLKNFEECVACDINANDEGADGLDSKEAVTRFGRDIQKLYRVFRKKLFITPILIPDYFDLPPFFRKRVRAVIWTNKRGSFKFFTKNGVRWLNALNQNNKIKSMELARPFFTGTFPDYKGVLREAYDGMSSNSPDTILKQMINEVTSSFSNVELYKDEVLLDLNMRKTYAQIREERGLSNQTISKIKAVLKAEGKL